MLLYGEWVEQNVLAPVVHRQYVFTPPWLLRPIFARRRAWLGELCRIAAHHRVRVEAEDREGRMKLAGYMLRAPISLAKMPEMAAANSAHFTTLDVVRAFTGPWRRRKIILRSCSCRGYGTL